MDLVSLFAKRESNFVIGTRRRDREGDAEVEGGAASSREKEGDREEAADVPAKIQLARIDENEGTT